MKYWEVVKRLTENPALSGVAVIGSTRYELYVDDSRTLQSATHYLELGINGTSLGKAVNIDFDGWEIVRQPVTWQEAIQAWADGKKISYSYMGYDKRFDFEDSNCTMSIEKIKNAEGYVED